MSQQGAAPIDPNEPILRRVAIAPGFYDPNKAPRVEAGAFRPNPNDDDGLSFYLESELSVQELANAATRAGGYVVVRLRAGDLYRLNLSLVRDTCPGDLPGHVIVPEINVLSYKDPLRRRQLKETCYRLALLADQNIVFDSTQPGDGGVRRAEREWRERTDDAKRERPSLLPPTALASFALPG